jgi:fluoroquinolone transport system permease protein
MRWDARLQFRHGFYYAAAFVAVLFTLILSQVPESVYPVILPIFVMGNMTINTFYFLAGLVILEKDEGILEGLVVSPLRKGEYLWSKILTLVILTLLENLIIVTLVNGPDFNWFLLVSGIILLGAFNALYAFIVVARYDSINTFLMPAVLYTLVLSIPVLDYFGLVSTPLMYLHPVQASLTLLKGAFQPIPAWQVAYGILYSMAWIGLLYWLSQRAFYRFIILKRGVR